MSGSSCHCASCSLRFCFALTCIAPGRRRSQDRAGKTHQRAARAHGIRRARGVCVWPLASARLPLVCGPVLLLQVPPHGVGRHILLVRPQHLRLRGPGAGGEAVIARRVGVGGRGTGRRGGGPRRGAGGRACPRNDPAKILIGFITIRGPTCGCRVTERRKALGQKGRRNGAGGSAGLGASGERRRRRRRGWGRASTSSGGSLLFPSGHTAW